MDTKKITPLQHALDTLEADAPAKLVLLRLCKAIKRTRIGVGIAYRRVIPGTPVWELLKYLEKDLDEMLGEDGHDKRLDVTINHGNER